MFMKKFSPERGHNYKCGLKITGKQHRKDKFQQGKTISQQWIAFSKKGMATGQLRMIAGH